MNKVALVTGGNSGIGYAAAKRFKKKKYDVYISGRNPARIEQAAKDLDVKSFVADVGDTEAVKSLASIFFEIGLDVLVNNAGIRTYEPVSDFSLEDFSRSFNINVRGPLLLIKALLPALEKKQGCIVNVSSIADTKGLANGCLYSATKGAVNAFTRSLALELAPRNIRINAVRPGITETPLLYKAGRSKEELKKIREKYEALIPLNRFATPEEVAHVIVAQAESKYATGAVWTVDGGLDVQ